MKQTIKIVLLLWMTIMSVKAEISLSGLFSDHMVMQRDEPVKVWGWAAKNEKVTVQINGQQHTTTASRAGTWEVTLTPMPAGGPHRLIVSGEKNSIEYNDILIGEVWLCSGQSNMEWPVTLAYNAEQEIQQANYPGIRFLTVPKQMHLHPQQQTEAMWEVCSPVTVTDASAVAYFYARELHTQLDVPVGVINATWGGSDIEAWISPEVHETLQPEIRRANDPTLIRNLTDYFKTYPNSNITGYIEEIAKEPGIREEWYNIGYSTEDWNEMYVPQEWTGTPLSEVDGFVWFNTECILPVGTAGKDAILSLGQIDDYDKTWVNGVQVGETYGYTKSRKYKIPAGILKEGRNVITVRITDNLALGGFMGKDTDLYLAFTDSSQPLISLAGNWKYRPTVINDDFYKIDLAPHSFHSSLYNPMIRPLIKFRIRGAIWYQGESNTDQPHCYETLFRSLISGWRDQWGYEFPYYWVQLPNFMAKDAVPSESNWAVLREAQTRTLSLPSTGQAVTIDIGEAYDLHPPKKQEVGRRLALIALNKTYKKKGINGISPTFSSMKRRGNKLLVSFDTQGSGLQVHNKHGYIEGFAIAGKDNRFQWAQACLTADGKVEVWNDNIPEPEAIRYGWANNPDVNLFTKEGLPVTPFRTDTPDKVY